MFRDDDTLIANPHLYGAPASDNPALPSLSPGPGRRPTTGAAASVTRIRSSPRLRSGSW
jgi:hypothetical protein